MVSLLHRYISLLINNFESDIHPRGIPFVSVRRMWCIRSFRYACASQLIPVIHFDPLSSVRLPMNTRLISPLHTTNVHSIPFRSRKLLPIFVNFLSGWKRMEPPPKFCSSAVSFLHTFCVHRRVGPGLQLKNPFRWWNHSGRTLDG